jgi:hypothetical protein
MTEERDGTRVRRFILEAVPTSDGEYQAAFRIHLEGALAKDDELHFGDTFRNPLDALDEARALAGVYLARRAYAV